jgi:hypothetical protein
MLDEKSGTRPAASTTKANELTTQTSVPGTSQTGASSWRRR